MSIKIAVVLPSRGLIFSETADELLQNLEGYDYEIFFAHGLSIPECFERPLTEALKGDFSHIFFCEDDQILPDDILDSMIITDVPVATCEYPVSKDGQGVIFRTKEGVVLFCGTGCTLVKREVFDKIKAPYFRTDIRWNIANYGTFIRITANQGANPELEGYGLHDVTFGMKLYKAGIPISVIGTIGQRKLIKLGKSGSNDGAHQIEEWTKVKPDVLFKRLKSYPKQPIGKLITVQTVSGELMVHPDKAKTLIKSGMATAIPKRSVVVDYNEVDF